MDTIDYVGDPYDDEDETSAYGWNDPTACDLEDDE